MTGFRNAGHHAFSPIGKFFHHEMREQLSDSVESRVGTWLEQMGKLGLSVLFLFRVFLCGSGIYHEREYAEC